MDKNELLDLITRINTQEVGIADSRETVRWKALREAETLTDPELFPLLQEIVRENKGKAKAKWDVRMAAGFIYGRLMEQAFDPESCAFFLHWLGTETDRQLLCSMLDRISDWQRRAGRTIPAGVDITPILTLAKDGRSHVRHSAIHALRTCPGRESREVLKIYLTQEDEKVYQYEMYYANIAMQSIGEPEDIPLLERFLKSRRPDLKITAQYAIQYIRERKLS